MARSTCTCRGVKVVIWSTCILTHISSDIKVNIRSWASPCLYVKKGRFYIILSSSSCRVRTGKRCIEVNSIRQSWNIGIKIPVVVQPTWPIGWSKVSQPQNHIIDEFDRKSLLACWPITYPKTIDNRVLFGRCYIILIKNNFTKVQLRYCRVLEHSRRPWVKSRVQNWVTNL